MRKSRKVQESIGKAVRWGLTILIIFGTMFFLRWLGWKGFIGIVMGASMMTYLILTKNPILLWAVKQNGAEEYVEEMKK